MSFTINPVQGVSTQVEIELEGAAAHEREYQVVEAIKQSIVHIIQNLGTEYLSVSCNGNINPVAGQEGDTINIHIVSLPETESATQTGPIVTPVEPAPAANTNEESAITPPPNPEGSVAPAAGTIEPGTGSAPGITAPPLILEPETPVTPVEVPPVAVAEAEASIPVETLPTPVSTEHEVTGPVTPPAESAPVVTTTETTTEPVTETATTITEPTTPDPTPPVVTENPAENPPVPAPVETAAPAPAEAPAPAPAPAVTWPDGTEGTPPTTPAA